VIVIDDDASDGYMSTAHTIECGLLHTGLPSCCVAYFIDVWTQRRDDPDVLAHEKEMPKVGYVPCPRCVKRGSFVVPKPCACNAHFEDGRGFERLVQSGRFKQVGPNAYVLNEEKTV
jgi:hypothetical protein